MTISIIGAGHIGGTLARLLVDAGHAVVLANSRGPDSLKGLLDSLGPQACAATVEEAAAAGEVVVLATPWRRPEALPSPDRVAGKVVVDAMNPYGEGGKVLDTGDDTSSGVTQQRLPGARLVKAFNTIYWEHLRDQGDATRPLDDRRALPIAGDDADAKATVAALIEQIGFAPLDLGGLRDGGRRQEPGAPLYNRSLTLDEARALAGG